MSLNQEAENIRQQAELIYSAEQIHVAIRSLAEKINNTLSKQTEPVLVMPIMNGGLILAGHLIPLLEFPVLIDYLHATRYRNTTSGSALEWKVKPQHNLEQQTILVIDDILDEGFTLQAVIEFCKNQGASHVLSTVLIEKKHPREKAPVSSDFIGLDVEDKYVFGFGMDYKGYHRNLNGIYAVAETNKNND